MANSDVYVVYNPHIDEFVKIKKYDELGLGILITELGKYISNPGSKITNYVRQVIQRTVENHESYNVDEVLESLFECVVEVYPHLQIEFVCKALNDLSDTAEPTQSESKSVRTLSGIERLRGRIKKSLIGQDEAVDECIKSIKLLSSGLGKFVSMFFVGPTGVGKTELARLLAKEYLGSPRKLIKINCAEYSNGHEYAKLIGSPPGYIGHNEKGILSEKADESSEWIILFDEIEKAHPKLKNLLLSLLDEGIITDSRGTDLDFTDSIICFTSNVGIKDNVGRRMVGFGNSVKNYAAAKEGIQEEFRRQFSPEFINRLDSVIHFNQLTKEDAAKIAKIHLSKLPIKTTKKLVDFVVEGGFSPEYGARNIKRFIRNNVTIKLADRILQDGKGKVYKAVFKNNTLHSVSL
jgi:ATP-dependent Clp protease ATP-binding subunit ClpA